MVLDNREQNPLTVSQTVELLLLFTLTIPVPQTPEWTINYLAQPPLIII
jgi:hypothetical protein